MASGRTADSRRGAACLTAPVHTLRLAAGSSPSGPLVHVVRRRGLQRQAVQDADVWGRAMLSVETARDAGRRIYASIRPAWMRVRDLAARRRLSSVAPILAVAAVLLLTARFYYDEQRYLEKLGPKALAGFA